MYLGLVHPAEFISTYLYYSLPEIQQELENSILSVRGTLYKLPKEPSADPRNEISNLLHDFVTHLSQHVEGVPDEDGLMQCIRPAQEKFKSAIRRTAPEFRPFKKGLATTRSWEKAAFLMDEDGGVNDTDEGEDCKIYIDEVLQRAHQ